MPQGARLKALLELNFKEGEKVKVSPVGDVIGYDGRSFRIDGEMVLSSIERNGLHIVLDENHDFAEAAGWFLKDSFEVRNDGVYASLEWTPKGKTLAENKSYRYLSPVFDMGDNRSVIGLDSVGFVNRPNLLNQEINKKEEEILNELEKLKAENTKLLEQNTALSAELAKLKGTTEQNTAAKGADDVENSPAYKALKEQNEKTLAEIGEMKNLLAKFGEQRTLEENNESTKTLSTNEKSVAKQLGLSEEQYLKGKGA
jgi:phage I-like protein